MPQLEKNEQQIKHVDHQGHATEAFQKELGNVAHRQHGADKNAAGSAAAGASAELVKKGVINDIHIHAGGEEKSQDAHNKDAGQAGKAAGDAHQAGAASKGADAQKHQDGSEAKHEKLSDEQVKNIKDALDNVNKGDVLKNNPGLVKDLQEKGKESGPVTGKGELPEDLKRKIEQLMKDSNIPKHVLDDAKKGSQQGNVEIGKNTGATPAEKNPAEKLLPPRTAEEEKQWQELLKKKIEDPRTPEEKRRSMQNGMKE